MKKYIASIFIIFISLYCGGQTNLVPNASFELYDTCPYSYSQINFASPWFAPQCCPVGGGSSDYFNICTGSTLVDVPNNGWGYQNARTGVAYAGIDFGGSGFNLREYIEVKLDSSLVASKKYYVGFYVSLANQMKYAVDAFGAYFSTDTVFAFNYQPLSYQPQFENLIGNIISDTANWVLVSGFFTATGGEQYMTIGNFKYDSLTNVDTTSGNSPYGYYYIDDVSVIDSNDVGINEPQENIAINIFPNPTQGVFTIAGEKIKSVEIINVLGEKIWRREKVTNNKIQIDISDKPKGVYFISVKTQKGTAVRKIIIQ